MSIRAVTDFFDQYFEYFDQYFEDVKILVELLFCSIFFVKNMKLVFYLFSLILV